ncbi:putative disease resistance RPP13-like protein 1 [Jatropha curcas]|uniref:putative disease resistance RPP13-like protein 1 n=1 Tax=Jatropha curcas TaxID=180498 RepID=UPI001895B51E|nr:putative disease resistance RPP13-like protein 1 [Jatropha curcas]
MLKDIILSGYQVEELPISVGVLKHLLYLNLSHTGISKLPESLCKLINLQILLLRGCKNLVELPTGIHNLINLLCLDIRGKDSLKEMPLQFSSLTNLCKLPKFFVGKGAGLGIYKLMKISPLHRQLCISGLQNLVDIRDAEIANLKQKEGLKELELQWIDDEVNSPRNVNDEFQVLNALQPHQNISSLSIQSFGGLEFPLWIGNPIFTSMVQLKPCNCHKVTSLPPLGRLPSLKEFSIQRMDGLQEVGVEFYEDSSCFACLEILCIRDMSEWEQWSWSESLNEADTKQFPKLHKLQISNCPKLVEKLPNYLPSLKSLDLFHCPQLVDLPKVLPSLTWFSINNGNPCHAPVKNGRNASNISYLTFLNIECISGLVSLPEAFIQALVALKNLYINYCHELPYLWRDGTNLDNLFCLETSEITSCRQLVSLVEGEEGLLPCNLKVVRIKMCDNFKKLPNGLSEFPERGLSIPGLETLTIRRCEELRYLPNQMQNLKSLRALYIDGCPLLESFPPLSRKMQQLDTTNIRMGTPRLDTLRELTIEGPNPSTDMILSFPDNDGLLPSSLTSVKIEQFRNLRSISRGIQSLTSLPELLILKCSELKSLPEEGLPATPNSYRLGNVRLWNDGVQKIKETFGPPLLPYPSPGLGFFKFVNWLNSSSQFY